MTPRTPIRTPIRTQADLLRTWRTLMSPLGFAGSSTWLVAIGPDDVPHPQLVEIAGPEGPPGPDVVRGLDGLGELVQHLVDEAGGGRIAFLRTRPGRHGVTDDDRAWAALLLRAAALAEVPADVVHLATDDRVVPLPADELPAGGRMAG